MTATALRECPCEKPEPQINRPHVCVKCGDSLPERWTTNDATLAQFFGRLEETFPAPPPWFEKFKGQVLARERAGRSTFRQSFLARDNLAEGLEEAADLALYSALDHLVTIRKEGEDRDFDQVLTAAWHAAQSWAALDRLAHKRRGTP